MAETVKSVEALWRKRQQQLNNPAPKRQRQQAPSSIELQLEIIRLEREASFLLRLAENLEKKHASDLEVQEILGRVRAAL